MSRTARSTGSHQRHEIRRGKQSRSPPPISMPASSITSRIPWPPGNCWRQRKTESRTCESCRTSCHSGNPSRPGMCVRLSPLSHRIGSAMNALNVEELRSRLRGLRPALKVSGRMWNDAWLPRPCVRPSTFDLQRRSSVHHRSSGLWTLDSGLWTLDSGLWTLDSRLSTP